MSKESQLIKLYTVKEVASILGVSVITARKYVNSGKLKSSKLSPRKTVISHADLNEFINKGKKDE